MRYPFAVRSPDGGGAGGGGGNDDPPPKEEEVKEWLADLESLRTELQTAIAAVPKGADPAKLEALETALTETRAELKEAREALAELKKRRTPSKPSSKSEGDDPPAPPTNRSRRPSEWV